VIHPADNNSNGCQTATPTVVSTSTVTPTVKATVVIVPSSIPGLVKAFPDVEGFGEGTVVVEAARSMKLLI